MLTERIEPEESVVDSSLCSKGFSLGRMLDFSSSTRAKKQNLTKFQFYPETVDAPLLLYIYFFINLDYFSIFKDQWMRTVSF